MPVLHMLVASNIDAEATNKCNGLFTNLKAMEDFMLGALGNQKVFLPKLCAGVQNLGIVKESHGRDTTQPLCIEHFIHMSAQVKLPVKKKIHWKGFIKLLSLHSVQMYFCSIILARTQHSGMHFGWPARMTACTSWVSDTYPLVLMCLWWMRVVTCCSQWPREWHLVQGSEVMRELNLKMSLLTTAVTLPTIRIPPPFLLLQLCPPPHLSHPPCPPANASRGGTLML